MTVAAVVFCCTIALALVEGYGAPAFARIVAADAIDATLPFVGLLLVARFSLRRMPARRRLIERLHVAAQGLAAGMAFGWWWVEPHTFVTSLTGSSLAAMGWQALAGGAAGFALALLAERRVSPVVFREAWLAACVFLLIGGGRLYRAFDHVEAGTRLGTAGALVAGVAAVTTLAYLALRRRERIASAIPALAPAAACLALLFATTRGGADRLSTRESILLIVVDTLRADIADGGMGGEAPAMPELARIAGDGIRFTQAVSPAPWTLPATVSLLSGWNPHRHRFGASASFWEVTTGDPAALYLAGAMRDAGYLASAFVHNPYLRPYFGFGRDFYSMRPYHGRAIDGVALALSWLGDHAGDASFTLLHLMDPHWPYDAPAGFGEAPQFCASCTSIMAAQYGAPTPAEKAELRRRYTAEVRFTDAMLGRFYDSLAAGGTLEHTWLIVTADHGEEFWEHGTCLHGHSLFDELLRVPLVVVPPKSRSDLARGRRIADQVRLEDVAATMLDIAGIDAAKARDGKSLLPLLSGGAEPDARVAVAGYVKEVDNFSYAVRLPSWKAIVRDGNPANFLFALDRDPGEQVNLFDPRNAEAARKSGGGALRFLALKAAPSAAGLDTARSSPSASAGSPDADTRRNLRSLGYAD